MNSYQFLYFIDLNSSSLSSSHTGVTVTSTTQLLTGLMSSSTTTTVLPSFLSSKTLVTSSDIAAVSSTQYPTTSVKLSTPFHSASPSAALSTVASVTTTAQNTAG